MAWRYRYVLQTDIVQFFPAIDHAILRQILAVKIRDRQTLWLIDQILSSGVGVLAARRPRGLPIGNLTSQFWANCYLNPFDHFVKRELRCPTRLVCVKRYSIDVW